MDAASYQQYLDETGDWLKTARTRLLEQFKTTPRSVLFGTDSFWMGVDVPGAALSNVIITRLPFAVPDHPLIEAKLELIEARGGDAFAEFSLPEAILKLRQGVGRLIRTKSDRGIVVIPKGTRFPATDEQGDEEDDLIEVLGDLTLALGGHGRVHGVTDSRRKRAAGRGGSSMGARWVPRYHGRERARSQALRRLPVCARRVIVSQPAAAISRPMSE